MTEIVGGEKARGAVHLAVRRHCAEKKKFVIFTPSIGFSLRAATAAGAAGAGAAPRGQRGGGRGGRRSLTPSAYFAALTRWEPDTRERSRISSACTFLGGNVIHASLPGPFQITSPRRDSRAFSRNMILPSRFSNPNCLTTVETVL